MANRNETDLEQQFLADLEKAKALSLETLELEKIRKLRYSHPDRSVYSEAKTLEEYKNYIQRKAQLHQGVTHTNKNISAPSAPQRNNLELRPAATGAHESGGKDEADLISFNAPPQPPNPQDEAHNNLKELVDQMHRLNTHNSSFEHSFKTQRSMSMSSATAFGAYSATYLQQQVAQNYNPATMQLVPYTQPTTKPKVLTPDELNRLYNMPTYGTVPVGPHQPGFVPQPQYPVVKYPQYPATYTANAQSVVGPTSSIISQPIATPVLPPTGGFIPHTSISATTSVISQTPPVVNPESALVPIPKPVSSKLGLGNRTTSQSHKSFPPAIPGPSNGNLFARNSTGSSDGPTASISNNNEVTLRPKSDPTRLGDNLIDLGFEDSSRVSVLEAFDPLLCGNRSSSGSDDKDETGSTYYEDYDPFDYIYSGGTQYSDPVYDAVNRSDKTPLSPNSIGSGAPPSIGWNVSSAYGFGEPDQDIDPPPPLPPRNTELYQSMTGDGGTISGNYEIMQRRIVERPSFPTKLYENVVIRKSYDKELIAFYNMVKQVRAQYRYDQPQTNVGHVVASEFDNHYPEGTSIKMLVHPSLDCFQSYDSSNKGQIDGYGPPIPFTCDIATSVEHVIAQVFYALEGQVLNGVSDYTLKAIGIQEILGTRSRLNQLECVHNSIKLEHDVQLGFIPKTPRIMQSIARTVQDDVRDAEIKLEHILPKEPTSAISYDDLMILLETLEAEIEKLQSTVDDNSPHTILSCSGVIQAVKAICNMLGTIDTLDITKSIDDLKLCCDTGQTVYSYNDSSEYSNGSLSILSESGDYAEVKLRPRTISQQIRYRCNEVRNAIQSLLEIYSHAFRVNFCVNVQEWNTAPIAICNISQCVMVNVMCLHRPPIHWRHDEYNLGVQIYHGARYISEAVVTYCSNEISGIYPRLKFNSWIMFRNQVCTLPRESRLIFVLYGVTREPVEGDKQEGASNSDGPAQEGRVTKVELGWSSIQFFDFERKMIQGSYLLSLWPPTAEKYFGPAPAKGTHPLGTAYPILGIEIPSYGGSVVFPEPIKNLPQWAKLDFNSLDRNLQQELIDTAEQGYSADKLEKREVLWEKRHYLHTLPHALPKILHAAHSWDYACIADHHALLKSWSSLTPVQALELLLPRYPDLEVRRQAVEWISLMPNDQFGDFLPQLLQALKHDTYEASPLANLLLQKALESPRIAHHMYWLLLHSLPGEAPQNMIEMGQLDETLVIQARYHRRNQLMLRALMATCGEKLTARFLSQNMMCKMLGEVAQSVKLAKESHRLQMLKQGLESVNQILIDNPTVLPLGPGNEVTGVVVRSCNYFNSNTLPLKINFMGPDKVIVPAIFKSGDDLQQDMLTIQMVRIMDKLWLREGLDLKMVTFNCVPTSYKKGMIEMVSDSETLRKIQVEWGLTGSFKDKSIAEWLAKQNPSQLEYQRAVENFTRSCAGYSVATYILGICDRHNDNIMLKTSGHLFHIDFGKFLGDAQMFGNFKRDRTPFVLTSDMAFVINGSERPSAKFHKFVDLCCTAFNIVRKHGDLILHMFALMTTSGIPGVTVEAVNYVRNALLPGQSNPEAAASFAKMIHISLKSWFTQFNFFLHNIAQMKFSTENDDGELLSFVPRVYTMAQDGRLKSVTVHGYQKRYDLEKYYTYILKVTRQNQPDPAYLFRSYKEFCEFHQKLCIHFPLAKLHSLPSGIHVGRSNVKTVAERRLPEIRQFLISLFNAADEIAHSDLVYTFFHPLLRDQQEADIHAAKVKGHRAIVDEYQQPRGEIKFSLQYHRDTLIVMIQHARSLPATPNNPEPNTYVKVYLRPDQSKATKRKTKVVRKNCNPSFMETLEYRLPLEFIHKKTLEVTVWSHDSLQENAFLGGYRLVLAELDLRHEINEWFPLSYLPRT
ncbi:phosphatidylinositol 4-phosphate 3-kinase C2 domain-containing subunit beta [Malaya genurostris]|uniref:phosphatidylinositol 4-phosphate 3-kinase C2 domain-containing subunit beta n=1 Tax=Malaya genurostris TaxID=325434 RepID=UPI0026F40838|nr:phosphatidylinositol 4-phosphate 3-kinase C2 domain-containing subunit beta [Malaya genurostris]XP_058466397.1 phosphatidylinositol 4-phosphate 3-kinase C2 domain-containing subunit beta [Malaya genurostris]XP_058466398.1 phosphatidylinositol 4-phosphate 3-kinase C2 domain-containing subunit beta [Malaya genurostris]